MSIPLRTRLSPYAACRFSMFRYGKFLLHPSPEAGQRV
jgi:hypothetical protein